MIARLFVALLPLTGLAAEPVTEFQKAAQTFRTRSRELGLRPDSAGRASGTNLWSDYHGRLYWNIRNDVFDAVPHEVTQTGGDKGILRRNQYGFSISGPVVIPKLYDGGNRTFFTLTFEGVRENKGRSFLETIATTPERTGDFSRTVDKAGQLLRIFDPGSTRLNPNFDPARPVSESNLQYVRDLFPGNRIPTARLDAVAADAVRYYPTPNVAIGPFFTNNYTNYTPERNNADGIRAKFDHSFLDRHRVSVALSYSNGLRGSAAVFEGIASPSRADRDFRTRRVSVDHVFTISPNSVNHFSVEARSSIWESKADTGDTSAAFPRLSFSPYLEMGRSYPVSREADADFEIENGITFRRGRHSISLDGSISLEQENVHEPEYPAGYFRFGDGLTSLPGIVNTGHAFASFLLGQARQAEESLVTHPSYWRQLEWDVGFRDEWEVRPGLTLSFGADLDTSHPRVEKFDRQSTVDLTRINPANGRPGALVFAGRDGFGRVFQQTRRSIEPYVSVAWSPFQDARTVIRARFNRRVDGYSSPGGHWGTQGFNGTPTFITNNDQLEPAVVLRDGLPPPANPLPDLRPEVANDTDAYLVDTSGRQPTSHSYRLSIERQLTGSLVAGARAEYSHGWNRNGDDRGASPNAIPLEALRYRDLLNDDEFNRSLRPYPQFRTFDLARLWQEGEYRQTELGFRLEKRTSAGLSLRFSYEFSRSMDNYRASDGLQDYYHREKEWALAYYDHPHSFSLRYMYELPFGPGRRYLSSGGWGRTILGGWSISGSTSYASGDPISLRAEFNNTGGVVRELYVNTVSGVDPRVESRGPELWFNPAAFVNPDDFTIGNVSRAHPFLRNPSRQNHDLAMAKRFRLGSEREVEFIGTALNFLNHANWNDPDDSIGSVSSPNSNAGRIIGSRGGRVIQLGLRFSF